MDRVRRTRWAIVAAVVGLAALSAIGIATRGPKLEPLEVSQQTTYVVSPTRADGWVDYPEAVDWMRRASLDAGGANAAQPLVWALGLTVLPVADRDKLLARLGIREPGKEWPPLVPLQEVGAADGVQDAELPEALEWLRRRCPVREPKQATGIFAWIAKSEQQLQLLQTASQAAGLYVPVPHDRRAVADRGFERVNDTRLGDALDVLACRAAVRLLRGDAGASWDDVDAIWRLGMIVARSASRREYELAAVFWRAAMIGTVDLAAHPGSSAQLLSAMQANVAGRSGFPPATDPLMMHRLAVLDAVGTPRIARPKAGQPGPLMARVGTTGELEGINRYFDALDAALQRPDPRERRAQIEQAEAAGRPAALAEPVGRALLAVEIQARSYQRLAAVALALARRQRDKGTLPASLDELGELPKDPGSGGNFVYKPGEKQFRLHGVGADGRDDHADPGNDLIVTAAAPPRLPQP